MLRWSLLIALVLAAFGLRLTALGAPPVWWDEAWSAWVAQQPLALTTELTARDVHPPLYQWLLHGWVRAAGISEFAVRYLSVLWGVLTVALAYVLGRRMGGNRAGWVALAVAACSVLLIRWSQETRMYAQAAALIALAAYATLRAQSEPQRRRWWVMIVVGSAGAVLTHYLGALAVGLLNIYALLSLRPRQWSTQRGAVMRWIGAMAAVAVLVGAWVVYALPLTRSGSAGGDFDAAFVFQLAASLFAVGTSTQITEFAALTVVITLGALAGLALSPRRGAVGLVLLFALAPPLVIYTLGVLETRFYSPKPEERYFILFAPVLVAGIGVAVANLTRQRWLMPLGIALAAVVIGVQIDQTGRGLAARAPYDDYAFMLRAVDALAQPGDVIVFASEDRYPLVYYHLNRADALRGDDGYSPLNVWGLRPPSGDSIDEAWARQAFMQADRVWFVRIEAHLQDPDGLWQAWLDSNYTRSLHISITYNSLTLYTRDGAPPDFTQTVPLPFTTYRPGDTVRVGADGDITLSDGAHTVTSAADGWRVWQFPVYPAMPAGEYVLTVDGQPTVITISGALEPVIPADAQPADFGGLALVGAQLDAQRIRPGQTVTLRLTWRVETALDVDWTTFVQLIGPMRENGPVWAQDDRYPADTPTSALWPGWVFTAEHRLTVPPDMPAGEYPIVIGLYRLETGERAQLSDGTDALTVAMLVVE